MGACSANIIILYMNLRFILCAGSKNVHLLVRSKADVQKYRDSRFLVAKTVASSVLDLLSDLSHDSASVLLSFLVHTRCTCVFEVLQPEYQHVVDLSHLRDSQLNFICWTLPYDADAEGARGAGRGAAPESHCAVAPDAALEFMASLGVVCVPHEVIPPEKAEDRMDEIRRGYGYEGEVMYFMDSR